MDRLILATLLFAAAGVLRAEALPSCSPSYVSSSSIGTQQDYQFNSFTAPSSYFTSPLNFDAVPGKVVVGGKDMLYLLSSDLALVQELFISGPLCTKACPSNLVRLYSAPSANSTTVVVCASAGPLCSLVDTSKGNLIVTTTANVPSSSTLLTSNPNSPSVDIFFNLTSSRNTNLFAASGTSLTFHTLNPNDPTSLNRSLKFGFTPMNNVFNLTTWFSPLLAIVDVYKADYPMRGPLPPGYPGTPTPDEHKYFFVFVREQDPVTAVVTNKLARLCQNDPGSVSAPNGLPFPTTLLKANISCQSSSGPIRPNLLQGVVFSRPGRYYAGGEWVELMYATFTDYSGYSPQTSICVYRANNSDALVPNGMNNRGVFDIFRSQVYDPMSGKSIANAFVQCSPNGRTDLAAQRINLAQSILQYYQDPLAILSGVVVTKMAVDQPCVLNGSSCVVQDVLFLGTSSGSVLKMSMTTSNGTLAPIISETIKLSDDDSSTVRQLQIRQFDGVEYLYVNTDNGIYRLALERCSQYFQCRECTRDPYCVWNNSVSQCMKFSGVVDGTIVSSQGICRTPSITRPQTLVTSSTSTAPCTVRSEGQPSTFAQINQYFTSPLNFDAVPGSIIVGAIGALYLLSSDLTLVQQLSINGPSCITQVQTCPSNLVRLYSAPSANSTTVVVCASAGPLCSLVDTSNGNLTMTTGYVPSSSTLLSSDPNTPSVGIFFNLTSSRNTNLLAASGTSLTFHTLNPNDPTSLNSSLKFGFTPMNNVFSLTTWFSPLLVIVDVYKADYPMRGPLPPGYPGTPTPDEHKFLFVFVREQDPVTAVVTNKLARLCQNDPGSVSAPNGLPFPTTLLKANISCQSSSGPMRPNLLQGVVFSRPGRYYAGGEWVELMYGTFTDYSGYSPQTSICVYRANNSDALVPNGLNNRGVFDIFRSQVYDPMSGKSIANAFVQCSPNGRSDLAAQRINLAQSILQYYQDPLAILSGVVVTKMAVDQPCVLNGSSCVVQDVLFLGTSIGTILKMSMTTSNGSLTYVISETIKLADDTSAVRQIQITAQAGVKYLYVNTDNGIYQLSLERCSQYLNCSGCVASRDPYCVWNSSISQCVKLVITGDTDLSVVSAEQQCRQACNGTVDGYEGHFTVPMNDLHNSQLGSKPISLCYGVNGKKDSYFNMISDSGVSVNAHYKAIDSDVNIIDQIAVKALDSRGFIQTVSVDLSCSIQINVTQRNVDYNDNGVMVQRTTNNEVLISVPNCSPSIFPLTMKITCNTTALGVVVVGKMNLNPTSHGIIGQFWNAPMTMFKYPGAVSGNTMDPSTMYVVTMAHPTSPERSFTGNLYGYTWADVERSCIYVGDSQAGPISEVKSYNGPVIEGKYLDYKTSGPFETDHKFNQFTFKCGV